ncbi:MAG: hypothetical protein N2560_06860 [Ignavibacteria bacterium]|nr:hypothetical protein [Ignavibacteria bacterium]
MKVKIFILLFFGVFVFLSCQQEQTTTPVSLSNISAMISGAINLEYSGAGIVTTSTLANSLVLNLGTSKKINNQLCMLGIFIFFRDQKEKTGVFRFAERDDIIAGDFAIGTFDIGEGNNRKQFVSDSGIVEITELQGKTVRGIFSFRAKEKTTGEIIEVKNGIISFQ